MQYLLYNAIRNEPQNDFEELLAVLNDEELLRIRHRFKKRGKVRLADIMTSEIHRREAASQLERRREGT